MMHGPINIRYIMRFMVFYRDKCFPVTKARRVLRLWMEERPPVWKVAANSSNKQSRAADKLWSSKLVVARDANNSSP